MSGFSSPASGELLFGLEADDRLVQQDVVEDRAERIVRVAPVRRRRGTASLIAVPSEPGWSGSSTGDGTTVAAPGLHHHPAVRLLVVARPGPCTPCTRGRTGRRRRTARSPTGRPRSRWPAGECPPACCRRPAARRCSACASRPARPTRPCSRCGPGCRAPLPGAGPAPTASAATAAGCRAPRRGCRSTARRVTSWAMSAIGNSGARSSGPTGWRVPGCSGGAAARAGAGATLNQASGIRSFGSR